MRTGRRRNDDLLDMLIRRAYADADANAPACDAEAAWRRIWWKHKLSASLSGRVSRYSIAAVVIAALLLLSPLTMSYVTREVSIIFDRRTNTHSTVETDLPGWASRYSTGANGLASADAEIDRAMLRTMSPESLNLLFSTPGAQLATVELSIVTNAASAQGTEPGRTVASLLVGAETCVLTWSDNGVAYSLPLRSGPLFLLYLVDRLEPLRP